MQKSFISFGLSFALFTSSLAQASYEDVPDKHVIQEISQGSVHPLSLKFSFMTWNVKKGEAGNAWAGDLHSIAANKALVLLQEGMEDDFMVGVLRSLPSLGWLMARSFFMDTDRNATGVITGGSQTPNSSVFLRTRDREPIIGTPKVSLLTTYIMEDGSRLLVVNIHAINFTTPGPFYRQIDDIIGIVSKWQDKVIFAGDFNTWIPARTKYLQQRAAEVGMTEVAFGNDPRGLILDRIFVRGCSPLGSEVHAGITTSDHYPLTTDFLCTPDSLEML